MEFHPAIVTETVYTDDPWRNNMKRIWLILLLIMTFAVISPIVAFAKPLKAKRPRLRVIRQTTIIRRSPIIQRRLIVRPVMIESPVMIQRPVMMGPIVSPGPSYVIVKNPPKPHNGPETGLAIGLFGNIPSGAFEIWFHKLLGMESTGLKTGIRYAQGQDQAGTMRKNTLIFADAILDLNPGPGAVFYIGGGPNYLVYTTGKTSGTIGAEFYLGVQEGSFQYGSLYAEAGYSDVETGFSPAQKGLMLNIGFKSVF